jgi:glucose-6-phosphate isomerase
VKALQAHYDTVLKTQHLRDLLKDADRNAALRVNSESSSLFFDYTHEKMDIKTLELLQAVADESKVFTKIEAMYRGDRINNTENRSVLHVALRKPEG